MSVLSTMKKTTLMIVAVTLLAGCGTLQVGREFDLNTFATRVQRGASTQSDVRAWLGEPGSIGMSVEADGEQSVRWVYFHGAGKIGGQENTKIRMLEVFFDAQNRVKRYSWIGK
jgi:hypothetical protein